MNDIELTPQVTQLFRNLGMTVDHHLRTRWECPQCKTQMWHSDARVVYQGILDHMGQHPDDCDTLTILSDHAVKELTC